MNQKITIIILLLLLTVGMNLPHVVDSSKQNNPRNNLYIP